MKTTILIAATFITLSSFTSNKINLNLIEAKNTTEDLIEWIEQDIENGLINNDIGQTYIENLNELQKNLNELK